MHAEAETKDKKAETEARFPVNLDQALDSSQPISPGREEWLRLYPPEFLKIVTDSSRCYQGK